MALPENLSGQALYNFIGGRRRVNAQRQHRAIDRRYKLLFTWRENPHMCKADLARFLGVSRSTITRDVQWLRRRFMVSCPLCGQVRHDRDPVALTELASDYVRMMAGNLQNKLQTSSMR